MLAVALGWYLGIMIFDFGVLSTVPVIIVIAGLGLLTNALKILFSYFKASSQLKKAKESIENILILYDLWYEVGFESSYTVHGIHEVEANLELYRL